MGLGPDGITGVLGSDRAELLSLRHHPTQPVPSREQLGLLLAND